MKPKKETEGKISYMEINPHFIAAMAKRMNENTKYPLFNYKLQMDMEGLLQLVDATERHLADLKCLLQNEPPVHNLFETPLDHLPAIANNAAMIFYQLSKYEFGNEDEEEAQPQDFFIDKRYIIDIFAYDNDDSKSEREKFVSQCKSELYEHVKNLFGDDFNITCDDNNVYVTLTTDNHRVYARYSMLDCEEQFIEILPIDGKTAKEVNLRHHYVELLTKNVKNQLEVEIFKKLVNPNRFPNFKHEICELLGGGFRIVQLRNDLYRIDYYHENFHIIITFDNYGNELTYEKNNILVESDYKSIPIDEKTTEEDNYIDDRKETW